LRLGTLNVGLGFTKKLPHIVARCSELDLDAVALQEIGDPALLGNRFSSYQLVYAPGPSHHEAGVGLLLPSRLSPSVRRYHRSQSGRLVGAVLELTEGQQLLLVSAYMPSGLDHQAPASPAHVTAHALYAEFLRWSSGVQQVIVLGDLNETLTRWDRQPQTALRALAAGAAAASSPLRTLEADGYTDVFRHLHPNAEASPGFTHTLDGARPSRSRIDYIWSKGMPAASLLRCTVDSSLHSISHHHLLWAELRLQHSPVASCSTPLLQLRYPNLRAATTKHKADFINRIDRSIALQQRELDVLLHSHTTDSLQQLASALTQLTHSAAAKSFPITGSKPLQSVGVMELQQQRRCLSRLLKRAESVLARGNISGDCLARNPEWRRQMHSCQWHHPSLQWCCCAWFGGDPHAWVKETRVMLNRTRSSIRKEQQRMRTAPPTALKLSSAALVHRMLESDALPSHLQSVVNAQGELTSSAEELETVMVDHFRNVFAMPPADATPLPHPPPAMLFEKSGVQPGWYDGLMTPVQDQEIIDTLSDAKLVSSPGEDGVSTGLWKLALQGSDSLLPLVQSLFSSCLALSFFPSAWKTSVIVPLVKDEKKERTMSNVRPISLQNCLGKLFMKVLAHRLGNIFARFPILNSAQRGFIHGGSINKCIDELLDAWELGRANKSELYTLFYDIAQAYDSVQRDVLLRAMRRLRIPLSFITLIEDSLTGLSSCVRTAYSVSRRFDVQRSLRQGCPLAPLLFVILMDALHDGLEINPFSGVRAGLTLRLPHTDDLQLASLGYADDTNILANNLANLRILNDWVHYFMRFNALRLNHAKCEMVGRGSDGLPVTAVAVAAAGILIEGHAVVPVEHDRAIRYLGVHCRFDGDWSAQHAKSTAMLQLFSRVVSKFKLSVSQAAYIFNTFLLPKLELALRYITGPHVNEWIRGYDRVLVGAIKHAIESPLRLSHSAVALSAGFLLPSWLEIAVKVSELFIRVNTVDADIRWSRLGRLLMLQQVGAVVDQRNLSKKDRDTGSRLQRAAAHAVNHLHWKMQMREEHSRDSARNLHLFARAPAGLLLGSDACTSTTAVTLTAGISTVAHDCWTGWGATAVARHVHVYTDGSHDAHSKPAPTSSWAVTVADRWLDDNFAGVPADESQLSAAHVGDATVFGASIACTTGVYPAELQAISRALAMFPLPYSLHIHSDSQAAIAGILAYSNEVNSRQRLRMAARPMLQLVHHQLTQRRAAGGAVQFEHVRAHSQATDIHSVGNRLTDYKANVSRLRPSHPTPLTVCELPLAECEHRLAVCTELGNGQQIIDDIRRTAIAQLKSQALARWAAKPPADTMDGLFACAALLDSSKLVLAHGSPTQQSTCLLVATNSIQCCVHKSADGSAAQMRPLLCAPCKVPLTLSHLAGECPTAECALFRMQQKIDLLKLLSSDAQTKTWINSNRHLSLSALLLLLFPAPPDVPNNLHFTRIMCGVFSAQQSNAAAKLLGFASAKDGRRLMQQIHLCCLDGVHHFYSALKIAVT